METLAFQYELRPELPNIYGALDYRMFRDILIKIDEILMKSGLEDQLISQALRQYVKEFSLDEQKFFNSKKSAFHYKVLKHALRCNIARHLTGESYRLFSVRLADSILFQWFTGISAFGSRKATSKSALDRYEKYFDEDCVADKIRQWLSELSDQDAALNAGLTEAISFKNTLMDSTCVKANIHFPVDWVLLRDAARSLLSAIKTIRAQGLKNRMIAPASLLKEMNKLCINMTHARRKKDSKQQRKKVLRAMKKLSTRIAKHAERYRQLLTQEWEKTAWTAKQMQQVVGRLNNVLEQLPQAIKQAHDRIIGERVIKSSEKILSLYDKDVQVIVRGKAGSEVEFGQSLLLTEQSDGIIIDWQLFKEQAPADNRLLQPAINRIEKHYGSIDSISADRAFSSAKNDEFLEKKNIVNAVCPKSPKALQKKLTDPVFTSLQTRRSQTEARIGIFKNVFLGKPLRSRITLNKRHAVNWCVLTHNLWVLSRKTIADEKSLLLKAA
jgi:hypothetical protein